MKSSTILLAALSAAIVADAQATDFLKVLDSVSQSLETIQDATLKNVQISTGFSDGAAVSTGTIFPSSTKTLYVSFTVGGAGSYLPVKAVWQQAGKTVYTHSGSLPKSGTVGEFHLTRSDGAWPQGEYKVSLVVQGKVMGSASFTISDTQSSSSDGTWGTTSTSATTATTTTAAVAPGVKDLAFSTGFSSGAATGVATTFPQGTKTIYLSYTATGTSSGVKVQAIWYREVSGTYNAISTLASTLPATGAISEFHLSVSGSSWPAGNYRVDLLVNGTVAGTATFKVEEAPTNSGVWQTSSTQGTNTKTAVQTTAAASTATTTTTSSPAASSATQATQSKLDDFFSK